MQIKTETIVGIFIVAALCIFFYMSFFLRVFRLDRMKYQYYTVYFNDVSGLEKKANVKIAGVNVGWVDSIDLVDGHYQAKAIIAVLKRYVLRADAHAVVRQEGLLGTKYLEVIPGDSMLPILTPGKALEGPGKSPVAIDDILSKVRDIADHVEHVTASLKESFGTSEGKEQLKSMLDNFSQAAEKIAAFSSTLDRTVATNEENVTSMLKDFKDFARDIKDNFPALKNYIERISDSIDRDISRVADKLEVTANALEDAALQARDGFKNVGSIAQKLDEGKGVLGKLINEEETYKDLKLTVQGLKNYFNKMDTLMMVLDAHSEYMYRPAEHVRFEDTKGYLDIRIHPNEDKFYILQLVSSQKGSIKRSIVNREWYDENGMPLLPGPLLAEKIAIPELIGVIETTDRMLDQYKFGFQFGKMFRDFAVRFGLFENTVGMGVDFDIPLGTDKCRWVTTLEAFDFRGRDRINDSRPHLKWLNRVFLFRNFYFTFGADDFVSKNNANGFFGGGIRFTDDDIKYFLNQVGLLAALNNGP